MFWSLMTYSRDMAYSCEVCGGDEDRRCTCSPTIFSSDIPKYCRSCESTICNCTEDEKEQDEYMEAFEKAQYEADYGYHDENEQ